MERTSPPNIQMRLFVLVVLAFLPAVTLYWYGNRELREGRVQDQHLALQRAADLVASDYDRIVDDSETLLRALAAFPQVRPGGGGACNRILADVLQNSDTYTTLSVIGTDGYLSCGSLTTESDLYLGDRNYFTQATTLNRFTVGDFAIGRITNRPTVGIALPLHDDEGRLVGVLGASIDLARLSERAALKLPQESNLTVLDHHNVIMVRHPGPADVIGTTVEPSFPSLPPGEDAVIVEGEDVTQFPTAFAVAPLRSGTNVPQGYVAVGKPDALLEGDAQRIVGNELRFLAVAGIVLLVLAWVFGHYGIARKVEAPKRGG